MKTKHTAETLKWYLGMEVYIDRGVDSEICTLKAPSMSDTRMVYVKINNDFLMCSTVGMYPILKTAEELTEEEKSKIYGSVLVRIDCEFRYEYGSRYESSYLDWDEAFELINLGYGAIPNQESPTGYVDLFGNPCVTPKQVEEGIEL